MTDEYEKKITNYMELIKKHGSKEAAEIIKKEGISFNEDFTESHRVDPIFSQPSPSVSQARVKTVTAWQLEWAASSSRVVMLRLNTKVEWSDNSKQNFSIGLTPESFKTSTGSIDKINVEQAISSTS